MKLLKEILHHPNINLEGRTIYREAVRGIIMHGNKLLMVYSSKNGDYKFPGGGVKENEDFEAALIREIKEECGATVSKIEKEFGKVIEYNIPIEEEYDVFKMTSYYYICKVASEFNEQKLDKYEKELGFKPIWVTIDDAIKNNELVMNSISKPQWLARENFVLSQLKQQLSNLK